MKIIITNGNKAADIIVSDLIEIKGNNIRFDNGEMRGLSSPPLILNDDVDINIGDTITNNIRDLDKSEDYIYIDKGKQLENIIDVILKGVE